jgi:uncharacterized protein (TIGR03067 family)
MLLLWRTPMHALLLIATSLFVAADAKDDEIKKELEKLQGKWIVVENEKHGKRVAAEDIKDSWLRFEGKMLTLRDMGKQTDVEFKLDPSKKLKTIELSFGADKMQGIYSLDGDNLKICIHLLRPDSKTPTKFTGAQDYTLVVLKREKK